MDHSERKSSPGMQCCSRRSFLVSGLALATASLFHAGEAHAQASVQTQNAHEFDGSTTPFPIPWLDKNGSHNQSPGPGQEPSNIFHFSGRIARCNNFTGMGTDNKGNRLAFGSPSTDFSFMQGEYFSGRSAHTGMFTHI